MMKKIFVVVLSLSIVPLVQYAACADNTTAPEGGGIPSRSMKTSYFQGIWTGIWPGYKDSTGNQDITITIGREIREKVFNVVYSWEEVTRGRAVTPSGKVRTEGIEKDGKLYFQWENKQGRKFEIFLQKDKDDAVKARLEKSGPIAPRERPYNETVLHRK